MYESRQFVKVLTYMCREKSNTQPEINMIVDNVVVTGPIPSFKLLLNVWPRGFLTSVEEICLFVHWKLTEQH